MIIFTARLRKGRLLAGAGAVLLLSCVLALAGFLTGRSTAAAALTGDLTAKTNEDRLAFFQSLGWSVSPDPVSVEELLIPDTLDETYGQYLALQESQGFDLAKYQGKRVKRYAYAVTNYPDSAQDVQASILVYRGKIIAGDLSGAGVNGFLRGLEYPGS